MIWSPNCIKVKICQIAWFPMYFTQLFLEAQTELEDKLGHFEYLECLKSPFLVFSGRFEVYRKNAKGMKIKTMKISIKR